jgi:HSP20 family protein
LPGIRPEDIELVVQGSQVTLGGPTQMESMSWEDHWLVRERRAHVVQRALCLPTTVQVDRVEARAEDGILTVTLPKAGQTLPESDETIPQRITVGTLTRRASQPRRRARPP